MAELTMDAYAMYLGYGVMMMSSLAAFAALSWWAMDIASRRLGWLRMWTRHSREILRLERERRGEKPNRGAG